VVRVRSPVSTKRLMHNEITWKLV